MGSGSSTKTSALWTIVKIVLVVVAVIVIALEILFLLLSRRSLVVCSEQQVLCPLSVEGSPTTTPPQKLYYAVTQFTNKPSAAILEKMGDVVPVLLYDGTPVFIPKAPTLNASMVYGVNPITMDAVRSNTAKFIYYSKNGMSLEPVDMNKSAIYPDQSRVINMGGVVPVYNSFTKQYGWTRMVENKWIGSASELSLNGMFADTSGHVVQSYFTHILYANVGSATTTTYSIDPSTCNVYTPFDKPKLVQYTPTTGTYLFVDDATDPTTFKPGGARGVFPIALTTSDTLGLMGIYTPDKVHTILVGGSSTIELPVSKYIKPKPGKKIDRTPFNASMIDMSKLVSAKQSDGSYHVLVSSNTVAPGAGDVFGYVIVPAGATRMRNKAVFWYRQTVLYDIPRFMYVSG